MSAAISNEFAKMTEPGVALSRFVNVRISLREGLENIQNEIL